MGKLPPGKRAVAINHAIVGRAHHAAMAVVRDAGERPIILLVVAASIIKMHAALAGTPVEVTLENVRSLIAQLGPVPEPDRN